MPTLPSYAYAAPTTAAPTTSGASHPNRQNVSLAGINLDETSFEVPEDLEWGHETWMSTHRIPQTGTTQAKIITQTFGVFPMPITFEARFLRGNVTKLPQLIGAQVAQQVVTFSVGSLSWDVVIARIKPKQRSRWDLGFTIDLTPLRDRGGVAPSSNVVSINATTELQQSYAGLVQSLSA